MPGSTGFVTAGDGQYAHEKMIDLFEAKLQAVGWVTLRKLNTGDNTQNGRRYELIMRGPGLSGSEQIFAGFQAYQSVDSDYYNITLAGFTGYLAGNSFDQQPGREIKSVCAHNQRIDYWLFADGQGLAFLFKVGTPVYESGYVGKAFPYASPSQYPYPMLVIGTLDGRPNTRFSDTVHATGLLGYPSNDSSHTKISLRNNAGAWTNPTTTIVTSKRGSMRDTSGVYHPTRIELCDNVFEPATVQSNIFGVIPHFAWITGFNNVTENTFTDQDGKTWVVFQDIFRNGIENYFALETTP